MKNFLLISGLLITYHLSLITPVNAAVSCQPIYGGGQSCVQTGNIVLNKKVLNPQNNAFVENLSLNDPKIGPDQLVTFELTITNSGDATLGKVTLRDIFPQFVVYNAGPGSYDPNSKTLSFDTLNLAAGESRRFVITGKVAPTNQLPVNQEVVCVVNQSSATSDNGQMSSDNAQFCIEKTAAPSAPTETKGGLKVFPAPTVTQAPSTGPEALALFGLIPTGLFGHFLRKKTTFKRGGEK